MVCNTLYGDIQNQSIRAPWERWIVSIRGFIEMTDLFKMTGSSFGRSGEMVDECVLISRWLYPRSQIDSGGVRKEACF